MLYKNSMHYDEVQWANLQGLMRNFKLEEIYAFTQQHKVEVLIQPDTLYHCFIDYKDGDGCYAADLDPLSSLVNGINIYKEMKI